MTIEIRDASLEARIQKQLQATGSSSYFTFAGRTSFNTPVSAITA